MKPQDIVEKVGADRIRKAMESESGDELKKLLDSEGIVLTPEQLDYIAGGIVRNIPREPVRPRKPGSGTGTGTADDEYIDDGTFTCDGRPSAAEPVTCI